MELTTQQQTEVFLWAFVLGAGIWLLWLLVGVIKAVSPPGRIELFVSDMILTMVVIVVNFLYAAAKTESRIRLYVIIAELVSFLLLHFLIGKRLKRFIYLIFRRFELVFSKKYKRIARKFASINKNWIIGKKLQKK